jgi:hypothetical protein
VAVRPQQHRGHVQAIAHVDDVVDPIRPAGHRKPAGLVEQLPAAAVHQPCPPMGGWMCAASPAGNTRPTR